MIKKFLKIAALWAIVARLVTMGGGMLVLPVVIKTLPQSQVTLYLLFMSVGMIVILLDFGFNSTLTRNISYAFSGADEIHREGVASSVRNKPNYELMGKLFLTSRAIYQRISLIALLLLVVIGGGYFSYVALKSGISVFYVLECWILFSISSVTNLYYLYFTVLLNGRGDVNLSNKAQIISKFVYVVLSITALLLGFQLLSLSLIYLVTGIVERSLVISYAYRGDCKYLQNISISKEEFDSLFVKIKVNAYKIGFVILGSVIIMRVTALVASANLGLVESGPYVLSVQIVTMLSSLAMVVVSVYMPKLSALAVKDTKAQLKIFSFLNIFSLIFYLLASLLIIAFGNTILGFLSHKIKLLPTLQLSVLLVIFFLETQHSNFALLISTNNDIPFVKASIFSALGVVILLVIFVYILHYAIWGLIFAQGVAQLAYQNWYWVYYACKKYSITYIDTLKLSYRYFGELLTPIMKRNSI